MIASGTTIERIVRGWRSRGPARPARPPSLDLGASARGSAGPVAPSGVVEGGGGLHGSDPTGSVPSAGHRTMVLPVHRVAHAVAPCGRAGRPPGWTRPLPRTPLDDLGDGRQSRTKYVARPGTISPSAQGGQQTGGRRRIAVEDGVGDADLHDRVRVRDGDAGQAVLAGELDGLLVAAPDEPGVVGLDPVDERRRSRPAAPPREQGAAEPCRTDAGCRRGRPAHGPRRSSRPATGRAGSARSRKRQIRSPSAVLTSSPTMTVRPSGAAARASRAPSMRSWSVIARWVRPRSAAARTTSAGSDRRIEAGPRVAMQVDERACVASPPGHARTLRSAGRGTS